MLTLKLLRDDPEYVIRKLAVKNFDARAIVEKVIALDDNRKALQTESDALLSQQKKAAAEIGALMKQGKKAEAEAAKAEVAALKARSNDLLKQADDNNNELQAQLVLLPNIPCDLVPEGKMLFKREDFTEQEIEMWNKELFERAVDIGETVLYIKQHSVNCIPAALYMLTRIVPELFTSETVEEFIGSLFANVDDIPKEDCEKIQGHIRSTFERFKLAGEGESDWTVPILSWLSEYEAHTPYYAAR